MRSFRSVVYSASCALFLLGASPAFSGGKGCCGKEKRNTHRDANRTEFALPPEVIGLVAHYLDFQSLSQVGQIPELRGGVEADPKRVQAQRLKLSLGEMSQVRGLDEGVEKLRLIRDQWSSVVSLTTVQDRAWLIPRISKTADLALIRLKKKKVLDSDLFDRFVSEIDSWNMPLLETVLTTAVLKAQYPKPQAGKSLGGVIRRLLRDLQISDLSVQETAEAMKVLEACPSVDPSWFSLTRKEFGL